MPNDYFAGASTQLTIKTPASVTADGNSAGVDIKDLECECMAVLMGKSIAGTLPTMTVKLQDADDDDVIDTVDYTGTGDGTLTEVEGGPDAVEEDITITFSNATTAAVVGSVTGAIGTATVGTKFTSPQISFMLTAGSVAFVNTDAFTVGVLARTYSDVVSFTALDATGSIQRKALSVDQLGRFLRANFDIGGTDNPAFIIGIALYGLQN